MPWTSADDGAKAWSDQQAEKRWSELIKGKKPIKTKVTWVKKNDKLWLYVYTHLKDKVIQGKISPIGKVEFKIGKYLAIYPDITGHNSLYTIHETLKEAKDRVQKKTAKTICSSYYKIGNSTYLIS